MAEGDLSSMAGDNVEAMGQHGVNHDGNENGDEISADHKFSAGRFQVVYADF